MIVSVPKYKSFCFPVNLNVDKCKTGVRHLFASFVYLKELLTSPTSRSKANTLFSHVIVLKHFSMLTGLFHPLHTKKLSLNFFLLNIHFRRCVNLLPTKMSDHF